jgi:hypothetical protein
VSGLGNSGVENSGYITAELFGWFGGRLVAFYNSAIHKCKFVINVRFSFVHTPVTVINNALLTRGSILDIFNAFFLFHKHFFRCIF